MANFEHFTKKPESTGHFQSPTWGTARTFLFFSFLFSTFFWFWEFVATYDSFTRAAVRGVITVSGLVFSAYIVRMIFERTPPFKD